MYTSYKEDIESIPFELFNYEVQAIRNIIALLIVVNLFI